MEVYFDLFADSGYRNEEPGIQRLMSEFSEPAETFEGLEILFAVYSYEDYSGDSFVLFSKDGELYEVTGSHCSCYGLEDQWQPEKVVAQELVNRTESSYGVIKQYQKEIVAAVDRFLFVPPVREILGTPFTIEEFYN